MRRLIYLATLICLTGSLHAQSGKSAAGTAASPTPLYTTIAALDTELFTAYNHCDLPKLGAMVSEDLEFYHDQTGLSIGRQVFLTSIQNNICGKVQRTLVPGSLEVYPLKNYGAVEIGLHRFSHPGHDTEPMGEAKFVEIWHNQNGVWTLTRVISYDHFTPRS